LRRTLQTAYNVYKNHPNFARIKFVLVPSLREAMDIACDIPIHIDDLLAEFR